MSVIVNLELKYKAMYDEFIMYWHQMNYNTPNDWDDNAKAMWDQIKSFESFCKIFFNININDVYSKA